MSASSVPPVGTRVFIGGNVNKTGVIKFVGSTSFAKGQWVGVLLEDTSGKNNGTVKGVKYFDAPNNRGLFVRPSWISKPKTGRHSVSQRPNVPKLALNRRRMTTAGSTSARRRGQSDAGVTRSGQRTGSGRSSRRPSQPAGPSSARTGEAKQSTGSPNLHHSRLSSSPLVSPVNGTLSGPQQQQSGGQLGAPQTPDDPFKAMFSTAGVGSSPANLQPPSSPVTGAQPSNTSSVTGVTGGTGISVDSSSSADHPPLLSPPPAKQTSTTQSSPSTITNTTTSQLAQTPAKARTPLMATPFAGGVQPDEEEGHTSEVLRLREELDAMRSHASQLQSMLEVVRLDKELAEENAQDMSFKLKAAQDKLAASEQSRAALTRQIEALQRAAEQRATTSAPSSAVSTATTVGKSDSGKGASGVGAERMKADLDRLSAQNAQLIAALRKLHDTALQEKNKHDAASREWQQKCEALATQVRRLSAALTDQQEKAQHWQREAQLLAEGGGGHAGTAPSQDSGKGSSVVVRRSDPQLEAMVEQLTSQAVKLTAANKTLHEQVEGLKRVVHAGEDVDGSRAAYEAELLRELGRYDLQTRRVYHQYQQKEQQCRSLQNTMARLRDMIAQMARGESPASHRGQLTTTTPGKHTPALKDTAHTHRPAKALPKPRDNGVAGASPTVVEVVEVPASSPAEEHKTEEGSNTASYAQLPPASQDEPLWADTQALSAAPAVEWGLGTSGRTTSDLPAEGSALSLFSGAAQPLQTAALGQAGQTLLALSLGDVQRLSVGLASMALQRGVLSASEEYLRCFLPHETVKHQLRAHQLHAFVCGLRDKLFHTCELLDRFYCAGGGQGVMATEAGSVSLLVGHKGSSMIGGAGGGAVAVSSQTDSGSAATSTDGSKSPGQTGQLSLLPASVRGGTSTSPLTRHRTYLFAARLAYRLLHVARECHLLTLAVAACTSDDSLQGAVSRQHQLYGLDLYLAGLLTAISDRTFGPDPVKWFVPMEAAHEQLRAFVYKYFWKGMFEFVYHNPMGGGQGGGMLFGRKVASKAKKKKKAKASGGGGGLFCEEYSDEEESSDEGSGGVSRGGGGGGGGRDGSTTSAVNCMWSQPSPTATSVADISQLRVKFIEVQYKCEVLKALLTRVQTAHDLVLNTSAAPAGAAESKQETDETQEGDQDVHGSSAPLSSTSPPPPPPPAWMSADQCRVDLPFVLLADAVGSLVGLLNTHLRQVLDYAETVETEKHKLVRQPSPQLTECMAVVGPGGGFSVGAPSVQDTPSSSSSSFLSPSSASSPATAGSILSAAGPSSPTSSLSGPSGTTPEGSVADSAGSGKSLDVKAVTEQLRPLTAFPDQWPAMQRTTYRMSLADAHHAFRTIDRQLSELVVKVAAMLARFLAGKEGCTHAEALRDAGCFPQITTFSSSPSGATATGSTNSSNHDDIDKDSVVSSGSGRSRSSHHLHGSDALAAVSSADDWVVEVVSLLGLKNASSMATAHTPLPRLVRECREEVTGNDAAWSSALSRPDLAEQDGKTADDEEGGPPKPTLFSVHTMYARVFALMSHYIRESMPSLAPLVRRAGGGAQTDGTEGAEDTDAVKVLQLPSHRKARTPLLKLLRQSHNQMDGLLHFWTHAPPSAGSARLSELKMMGSVAVGGKDSTSSSGAGSTSGGSSMPVSSEQRQIHELRKAIPALYRPAWYVHYMLSTVQTHRAQFLRMQRLLALQSSKCTSLRQTLAQSEILVSSLQSSKQKLSESAKQVPKMRLCLKQQRNYIHKQKRKLREMNEALKRANAQNRTLKDAVAQHKERMRAGPSRDSETQGSAGVAEEGAAVARTTASTAAGSTTTTGRSGAQDGKTAGNAMLAGSEWPPSGPRGVPVMHIPTGLVSAAAGGGRTNNNNSRNGSQSTLPSSHPESGLRQYADQLERTVTALRRHARLLTSRLDRAFLDQSMMTRATDPADPYSLTGQVPSVVLLQPHRTTTNNSSAAKNQLSLSTPAMLAGEANALRRLRAPWEWHRYVLDHGESKTGSETTHNGGSRATTPPTSTSTSAHSTDSGGALTPVGAAGASWQDQRAGRVSAFARAVTRLVIGTASNGSADAERTGESVFDRVSRMYFARARVPSQPSKRSMRLLGDPPSMAGPQLPAARLASLMGSVSALRGQLAGLRSQVQVVPLAEEASTGAAPQDKHDADESAQDHNAQDSEAQANDGQAQDDSADSSTESDEETLVAVPSSAARTRLLHEQIVRVRKLQDLHTRYRDLRAQIKAGGWRAWPGAAEW